MQNSRKQTLPSWLSWLFVVIFLAHFTAIVIHQFGKSTLPGRIVEVADRYASPWFFQNYEMFAPEPHTQINKFVYRAKSHGEWSTWKDPVYPHLQDLWSNRFGHGGDMYRIIGGIADKLYEGQHFIGFLEAPTPEQCFGLPGFQVAERYVLRQSEYADDPGLEGFQVGVLTEVHHMTEAGEVRVLYLFQPYPEKTVER
ncbi:MAG: hypothetical protein HQ500_06225 [Flavobacteriales bacterium]|nr:hypothetical protein [Flavobacteriales bacterium]